jgi:putative spermidine/putrescine transport system substrate-binding protein
MRKAWGEPLQAASGLKFTMDGSGPTKGRVRARVESGRPMWDVCDASIAAAFALDDARLLEPIDYTIIDKSWVRDGTAYQYAVTNYIFSYTLAIDTRRFGAQQPPIWADMWAVKDFPGKRALRASCIGQLEGALIADGVPRIRSIRST